jgi:pyruvate-formate lyase-activating enzyme
MREELPVELLARCVEDAACLGYRQLAVSGGEPLLYEPLPDLLSRARAVGMLTTVTSNGMLLSPSRWEPLAGLVDMLAISIDGTPAEHDRIRRCEGAFARTVANLETVRASSAPFSFAFTLTQHNVDSLEFVIRLAADVGARSVHVQPLTLSGRAAVMMNGARPDEIEIVAALCKASTLGRELGIAVRVDAITADRLLDNRSALVPELPVAAVVDVAPVLIVRADANVIPLTHDVSSALGLGSLQEASLRDLAAAWIARGAADTLADACARAWTELTVATPPLAVYWYDIVAALTWSTAPHRAAPDRELTLVL